MLIGSHSPENQTSLFLPFKGKILYSKYDFEGSMIDCGYHGNDTSADLYMAVFVHPPGNLASHKK